MLVVLLFTRITKSKKKQIMAFQTINPTTNEVVKSFDETTDVGVEEALAKATIAFDAWENTDYPTRVKI